MLRLIILLGICGVLLSFEFNPGSLSNFQTETFSVQDTIPSPVNEDLLRELLQNDRRKTWRDSGYYFQLEPVFWRAERLRATSDGDVAMSVSFSSGDPSSLRYRGRAIFALDPNKWPADIMPARGMQGEALVAFPQDVLFCPSPSQEVGLGQNDPFFPLYLSGQLTGVMNMDLAEQIPVVVQLIDMEIIL